MVEKWKREDIPYETSSLADAQFVVYAAEDIYTPDYQRDEDGNRIVIYAKDALVATVTTGADGSAVVEDLPLGTYRIEETKAPFGFVLNTEPQTVTFSYADHEKVLVEADTLLEEVTSDENGLAAFTLDLPLGQYYVKEHKTPAGYVSSDEVLTFDAGYQGQDVPGCPRRSRTISRSFQLASTRFVK